MGNLSPKCCPPTDLPLFFAPDLPLFCPCLRTAICIVKRFGVQYQAENKNTSGSYRND
ncbi:MAG: hypothetical protein LBI18_06700 [Planctomycetaceae bacterium]|nr:hypothetical protein [Planctomycetaceae bacterium]